MSYPTTLDDNTTLPVESASTALATNHVTNHTAMRTAIIAIETLMGVTASAVTGTFNYILGEITGSDKAVGKTATQTVTNKTLGNGTKVTIGSDADKDMYYRASDGTLTRIPVGTDNQILKLNGTTPGWEAETVNADASYSTKGIVQGLTDAATSGLTIASGVISVNSGTTANKIVKLDANAKLPAVNGDNVTLLENASIQEIIASGSLQHTNATNQDFPTATTPVVATKFKETVYNDIAGTIRVGWTAGLASGGGVSTVRSQVYKNGVAQGSTHDGTATYSEDITVADGDLIQIYAFVFAYTSGNAVYRISNLTLSYTKQYKATYTANTSNL